MGKEGFCLHTSNVVGAIPNAHISMYTSSKDMFLVTATINKSHNPKITNVLSWKVPSPLPNTNHDTNELRWFN